jgi:CDP-diacylglycerol--glycerol-3-phosphate 3-phosphatidyltransferase
MNLPNQLTVARFFLTLLFVAVLSANWRYGNTAALAIFLLASATDYADGEIARRYKLETNFGRLMDPLVDKIMLAAAFICLVQDSALPAWAAVVIISREFLITGLRLLGASQGVVMGADAVGKHKTAWQMVTVIYFLLLLSLREVSWAPGVPLAALGTGHWYYLAWHVGGKLLIALALILTLYSGFCYLWKNRELLKGM